MAGPRSAKLFVGVGQKESGKSSLTLKFLQQYVMGDPTTGFPPRRALIFDTQYEFEGVKTLPLDKVGLFSVHPYIELRRILPFINGREMTPDQKVVAVKHILQHLRNSALVLEDINNYIFDYMPGDVVGEILSQRHLGIDLILHYHSLGRIHEKVWPHINIIRLHKCEDTVVDNRLKFPEKFEMFKIAENIVNDQFIGGNKYYYLHIQMLSRKIIADDITDEQRNKAVDDYLTSYSHKLISPMLKQRDKENKVRFTYSTAYDRERERIIQTYFTI